MKFKYKDQIVTASSKVEAIKKIAYNKKDSNLLDKVLLTVLTTNASKSHMEYITDVLGEYPEDLEGTNVFWFETSKIKNGINETKEKAKNVISLFKKYTGKRLTDQKGQIKLFKDGVLPKDMRLALQEYNKADDNVVVLINKREKELDSTLTDLNKE